MSSVLFSLESTIGGFTVGEFLVVLPPPFDPRKKQTRPQHGGAQNGFGPCLFNVKSLVDKLDGHVELRSYVGEGTTVSVVIARVQKLLPSRRRFERDPAFAQALLDEVAKLFVNGEPETARLILRDLINATIGFEQLAH